jgi:putative transposase
MLLIVMPRANKYIEQGHVYHVTQRCHNRSFLLKFAVDRDENRERLRKTLKGSYVWMLADYLPAGRYAPAWPASW